MAEMKDEDDGKVIPLKEAKRVNKWLFIHSYIKSIILNSMSTVMHGLRMVPNGVIQSNDEIKSTGLKEIHRCIHKAYDIWLSHNDGKGPRHMDIVERDARFGMNVAFTIANEDYVYEELFRNFYEELGVSYAKNILGITNIKEKDKKVMR